MLHDRFGIEHTTLQVDHEGGDLLSIEVRRRGIGAAMRPFLALALLRLAGRARRGADPPVDTTPTIAADGIGTATLTPDVADFAAGVERVAPTSRGARNAANRRMAAVLRRVKAGGVADADIRTVGLTVQRERVKKKRVRYRAQQTIVVHVRDVAGLAPLLDAVAAAGADAIGDPEFGFADPSAGRTAGDPRRAGRRAAPRRRRRRGRGPADHRRAVRQPRPGLDDELRRRRRARAAGGGSERLARERADPGRRRARSDFAERVRVIYTAAPAA